MKVTKTWIENNFNKFNNEYFEGKLPTPSFIICDTYRMLGQCGAKNWRSNHPNFVLKISNHFDRKEKEFQNTLIHEMIHLYFQSKGMWKVGHGREFQRMAREFDKYGWNIHTKEEGFKSTTTDGTIPTRVVMTFEEVSRDVVWVCCVATDKIKIQHFFNLIKNTSKYTNPHFYLTNSDKFGGLKISHKKLGGKTMTMADFKSNWLPKMTEYNIL